MFDLPIHPAIVHLPLGLAFVLPLVATALLFATWRDHLPRKVLWLLPLLQVLVFSSALLAERTGEADEERVEAVVPEAAIEAHEHAAERFTVASGVLLLALVGGAALPWTRPARWLVLGATVASFGTAGLGLQVGHAGGELVYRHGAASAGLPQGGLSQLGLGGGGEGAEGPDEDEDEDD